MKTTTTVLPVFSVNNRKNRIDPKPQYQRGAVWSEEKKQLLIDTILRGYDIPKFYLRDIDHDIYEQEVVDGQQRLRSIWEFMNNEFPLGEESKDFDDLGDLEGKYYRDLSSDEQDRIGSFSLSITILQNASDIQVRELFLRLQEGTSLNPPEKRNAMVGKFRDFVHELANHPIFLKTGKNNTRFLYDDWAAHVSALEISGGPIDIKAADLKALYEREQNFDENSPKAKKIKKVLNYMDKVFPEQTPELSIKWGFVDLYWLISKLLEEYNMHNLYERVYDFYLGFEQERRSVSDPADLITTGKSDWKRDLYDYIEAFQKSGALRSNLEKRYNIYLRKFLYDYPELIAKDPTRNFTQNERIVLWRRAGMKCENSSCGKSLDISEMHADHIKPHSEGGVTSIENGQCLCGPCILSKGAKSS